MIAFVIGCLLLSTPPDYHITQLCPLLNYVEYHGVNWEWRKYIADSFYPHVGTSSGQNKLTGGQRGAIILYQKGGLHGKAKSPTSCDIGQF